jgi:hypothetical protein
MGTHIPHPACIKTSIMKFLARHIQKGRVFIMAVETLQADLLNVWFDHASFMHESIKQGHQISDQHFSPTLPRHTGPSTRIILGQARRIISAMVPCSHTLTVHPPPNCGYYLRLEYIPTLHSCTLINRPDECLPQRQGLKKGCHSGKVFSCQQLCTMAAITLAM